LIKESAFIIKKRFFIVLIAFFRIYIEK